ncbi:hypothetical protein BJ878DRAFT_416089 [Calycina marina]|uniref:Uncharacterized protein n=1 Tax=Calycina marina TaxID=1763456 RepID=A0A9P8CH32_9HELO|nr:hypothetical protein BJ878DRAFT_416089 [Calycina marina]
MQHCSFSLNNGCANTKIHNFFKTGELPGADNFCASEVGAFGVVLKDLMSLLPPADSNDVTLSNPRPEQIG